MHFCMLMYYVTFGVAVINHCLSRFYKNIGILVHFGQAFYHICLFFLLSFILMYRSCVIAREITKLHEEVTFQFFVLYVIVHPFYLFLIVCWPYNLRKYSTGSYTYPFPCREVFWFVVLQFCEPHSDHMLLSTLGTD